VAPGAKPTGAVGGWVVGPFKGQRRGPGRNVFRSRPQTLKGETDMSIQIKFAKSYLQVANIRFFTTGANSVELGSWGEKKEPLTQPNYLMVMDRVPAGKLKIRKSLDLTIDSTTLTEGNLGAGLTVPGVGNLKAGVAADKLRREELHLVMLEVLPADMADAVNESPKVIEGFRNVGNDGRLVHKIIVALDAKTTDAFKVAGSVSAEVADGNFKVKLGGGTGGITTVSFENATLAYLLLKPEWNANLKKNWTRMVGSEDDRQSLN
jgi:hypothetical protein